MSIPEVIEVKSTSMLCEEGGIDYKAKYHGKIITFGEKSGLNDLYISKDGRTAWGIEKPEYAEELMKALPHWTKSVKCDKENVRDISHSLEYRSFRQEIEEQFGMPIKTLKIEFDQEMLV